MCSQVLSMRGAILVVTSMAVSCSPRHVADPSPVLVNRGRITKVHLNEITSSGPRINDELIAAFESLKIDYCLTTFVLCYGSSTSTAGLCTSIPDYCQSTSSGDSLGMNKLLPLYDSSLFQNVSFKDERFRWDALNPLDRIDFILSIGDRIDGLEWKDNHWVNDELIIGPMNGNSFDKGDSIGLHVANAFWKKRREIRGTGNSMFEDTIPQYIDWEMVCGDWPTKECQDSVVSYLSVYAQDRYVVRQNGCLRAVKRPYWAEQLQGVIRRYSAQLCDCTVANTATFQESIPIRGGNYFVRDSVVFVGANAINNFLECSNWAQSIGLSGVPSRSKLDARIVELFTGSRSGHVIWVGDRDIKGTTVPDCSSYPNETDHVQPLYHIDIFFHPLGTKDGTNEFYYIFSIPEPEWHEACVSESMWFKILLERLETTEKRLRAEITSKGLIPKPIILPMVVRDFGQKYHYISFANGHSEHLGTSFKFLMPDYMQVASQFKYGRYEEVRQVALDRLTRNQIETALLPAIYGANFAAHCLSKVLEREVP